MSIICHFLPHSGYFVDELTHNATLELQIHGFRCIEGLARAAREQIRDREHMRTFEVYVGNISPRPTVLVEAHFERLVMVEKRAHSHLTMLSPVSKFLSKN